MMRGLQHRYARSADRCLQKVAELGFKANAETLLDDMEAIL